MAATKRKKRELSPEKRDAKLAKLTIRGKKYFNRKDWANAAKYYVAAWDMAPDDKDLLVIVSHLLVQLGVREKAILVLEKALEVNGPTREVISIMGEMALAMRMHDIAEKLFTIAIELYPDDVSGYNSLANALGGQDRHDESIALLQNMIPVFPNNPNLWNTLAGHVSLHLGFRDSLVFYEEAYRLAPNDYRISNNLARAHDRLGDRESAVIWSKRSVEASPDQPMPKLGLGLLYLALGNLEEGWDLYRSRLDKRRQGEVMHYTHDLPEWDGSDLSNKTIFAASEQGVGDELLFGAALPQLAADAGKLYIGCDKRLMPSFKRSFPEAAIVEASGVERFGYNYRIYPELEADLKAGKIEIDCAVAFGDVPGHYWRSADNIAEHPEGYLKPDPKLVEKWRDRLAELGDNPKIGIAWRSGKVSTERNLAYLAIEQLAPILEIPGLTFVNLQYGECAEEVAEIKEKFGVTLHQWQDLDLKDDFEDIFGLMKKLDLVISPSTAVAMMAMAIGAPVWWMLRANPWFAFGTGTIPFFAGGAYFWAPIEQSWTKVTDQVAERLEAGVKTGEFTPG